MKHMVLAVAAALFVGTAGGVHALTLASGATTCSVSDLTIGGLDASACEGAYAGNDSNQNLDGIFGLTGWSEIVKVDDPAEVNSGNGVTLTVSPAGGTSGDWVVDTWAGYTTVMAVLKGGPTFSAYLIDVQNGFAGTWNTDGILKGNNNPGPDLSHMTLYTIDDVSEIPLPAAGWLMLAGLGGLGLTRRRRKG